MRMPFITFVCNQIDRMRTNLNESGTINGWETQREQSDKEGGQRNDTHKKNNNRLVASCRFNSLADRFQTTASHSNKKCHQSLSLSKHTD